MLASIMSRHDGSDASFEVWLILIVMAILTFFLWRARAAAPAFASAMATKFQPDDLKVVEGIGPKIEQLLKGDGILTWSQLARVDTSRLQGILSSAGPRFKMHKPESWPTQAQMAEKGQWEELEQLQQRLVGGVEDSGAVQSTPSVVGSGAAQLARFSPDDLKVVEGIGPKIEELLKAGGITNWQKLAQADLETLQGILTAAGPRFKVHNPKTWPNQAEMADKGQWDKLQEYQDYLQGGRE